MNGRARTRLQSMKNDKMARVEKIEVNNTTKSARSRRASRTERKLALQQDVEKLKRKLRQEENIHRALERAFSRPLGALPRLPPYLSPPTLELLAEVAVLEEEVVRLEKQVALYWQCLYQEAVYIASSKRICESSTDMFDTNSPKNPKQDHINLSTQPIPVGNAAIVGTSSSSLADDAQQKESCTSSVESYKGSSMCKSVRAPVKKASTDSRTQELHLEAQKPQPECRVADQENIESRTLFPDEYPPGYDSPNTISENVLRCLSSIFSRMSSIRNRSSIESLQSISSIASCELSNKKPDSCDPYGICSDYGNRDIGPYKHLYTVEAGSINPKRIAYCLFLGRRLKLLLGKLASDNLQRLNHQEKLAFWINTYISCMMNVLGFGGTQNNICAAEFKIIITPKPP